MATYNKKNIEDVSVQGKTVLVRCDFNVPMKDGVITSDKRIVEALPTIKYLLEKGAKLILCSHMGKPHSILTEGFTAAETNSLPQLASAAAGLIRLGERSKGISLYKKLFEMVWERKSTSDDKKEVMDSFLERLAKGYENEPYIDSEISAILEEQCKRFSDIKWVSKIKLLMGRNGF